MSRLKLLEKQDVAPEFHDIFGAGMNLHRMTLHSPRLARMSRQIGLYFRRESKVDPRLTELGILQVAQLARSTYEYSHHIKIGLEIGLTDAQFRALAVPDLTQAPDVSEETRAVLQAARDMVADGAVSDATFGAFENGPGTAESARTTLGARTLWSR